MCLEVISLKRIPYFLTFLFLCFDCLSQNYFINNHCNLNAYSHSCITASTPASTHHESSHLLKVISTTPFIPADNKIGWLAPEFIKRIVFEFIPTFAIQQKVLALTVFISSVSLVEKNVKTYFEGGTEALNNNLKINSIDAMSTGIFYGAIDSSIESNSEIAYSLLLFSNTVKDSIYEGSINFFKEAPEYLAGNLNNVTTNYYPFIGAGFGVALSGVIKAYLANTYGASFPRLLRPERTIKQILFYLCSLASTMILPGYFERLIRNYIDFK